MNLAIRQTGIVFLAFLVLFSTTGLAIYHHICGCPVPVTRSIQTAESVHSCCHLPEQEANSHDISPVSGPPPSGKPCCGDADHSTCDSKQHDRCRNEVTYLRAPIISPMPVQANALQVPFFSIPDTRMPDAGVAESVDDHPVVPDYLIPPRAGGSLVIFLHSIKIPSPANLA